MHKPIEETHPSLVEFVEYHWKEEGRMIDVEYVQEHTVDKEVLTEKFTHLEKHLPDKVRTPEDYQHYLREIKTVLISIKEELGL